MRYLYMVISFIDGLWYCFLQYSKSCYMCSPQWMAAHTLLTTRQNVLLYMVLHFMFKWCCFHWAFICLCFHVFSYTISPCLAAFAPMNMESNFGRHDPRFRRQDDSNFAPTNITDNLGSHGQTFGNRSDRSFQNNPSFRNQRDSSFQNESSFRSHRNSDFQNESSFRKNHFPDFQNQHDTRSQTFDD